MKKKTKAAKAASKPRTPLTIAIHGDGVDIDVKLVDGFRFRDDGFTEQFGKIMRDAFKTPPFVEGVMPPAEMPPLSAAEAALFAQDAAKDLDDVALQAVIDVLHAAQTDRRIKHDNANGASHEPTQRV